MGDGGFLVLAQTALIETGVPLTTPTLVDVGTRLVQQGSVGRLFFEFPAFETNTSYDPVMYAEVVASGESPPPPAPPIEVVSPGDGDQWPKGSMQVIQWTSDVGVIGASVKIYLFKGGQYLRTIDAWDPNDGSYTWVVDEDLASGSDYQIAVMSAANKSIRDYSDGLFTIDDGGSGGGGDPVTVLTPNGGESWPLGSQQTIQWTSDPAVVGPAVKIYLFKGGQYLRTIDAGDPNDGSYTWVVEADLVAGSDYTLAVMSAADKSLRDYSDGAFTIGTVPITAASAMLETGDIRVTISGQSGKFTFWNDAQQTDDEEKKFKIEFNGLQEETPAGDVVDGHRFNNFASQDFEFSELIDFGYPGFDEGTTVTAKNIDFMTTLTVDGEITTMTAQNFLFTTTGTITVDGEAFAVEDGYLKFTVDIEGWPFSDPANELVLEMAVKTPSRTPEIVGNQIDMGEDGFLVLAETALIDTKDSMTTPTLVDVETELVQQGLVGRLFFHFPAFGTDVSYDPVVYRDFVANTESPQPIQILSPNGGESWAVGSRQTIRWTSDLGVIGEAIKIYLFKGGHYLRTIDAWDPNDGSYTWVVEADLVAGSDYTLAVMSAADKSIRDYSDGAFTIR